MNKYCCAEFEKEAEDQTYGGFHKHKGEDTWSIYGCCGGMSSVTCVSVRFVAPNFPKVNMARLLISPGASGTPWRPSSEGSGSDRATLDDILAARWGGRQMSIHCCAKFEHERTDDRDRTGRFVRDIDRWRIYCPSGCAEPVVDDMRFCPFCGTPVIGGAQ
jgi:hypothetical protein